MTDVLNAEDLVDITGAKNPKLQCEVLRDNGIRFIRRHDGRPVVTWTSLNNMLSASSAPLVGGDGFNLDGF